jgi:hypothetical protein
LSRLAGACSIDGASHLRPVIGTKGARIATQGVAGGALFAALAALIARTAVYGQNGADHGRGLR